MPLEVATLTVTRKDVEVRTIGDSISLVRKTGHVRITQYNYGRVSQDSPGKGLCTDLVASCTAVVLHCPSTKRTTLSHSPNFMYMTTFIPLIDWVTGGHGKENPSVDEQMAFFGGSGAEPCVLEAHILRGYAYAKAEAVTFNHVGWLKDFREFFGMVSKARQITLHIFDSERLLRSGAVLVDKTTGKITHVELVAGMDNSAGLLFENPHFIGHYSGHQVHQDLFLGSLYNSRRTPEPMPLRLQFDVDHYCLPHPLTDEARLLIRSKRVDESPEAQSAIIREFGNSDDWIALARKKIEFVLLSNVFSTAAISRPCELCPEEGAKTCSACHGAWYCGDAHQRLDWKAHKGWCRRHPYSK